jgi:signal transduction histidine kinase
MLQWFRRLPLVLRFPIAVALMIFLVAVTTTQVAIQTSSSQFERQMGQIGQVYLDGLAAALIPALAAEDHDVMSAILERSLTVREGIEDLRLAVLDEAGHTVARADRTTSNDPARDPSLAQVDDFAEFTRDRPGMRFDESSGSIWVWRPLPAEAPPQLAARDRAVSAADGRFIVANLDVADFIDERRRLRANLLLFDLLFSGGCAALGFYVVRQLQRPITVLTEHLRLGEGGRPEPVAPELMPREDPQIAGLLAAYNRMVSDARQREAMISHVMQQERDAILGRMAATLAHEIRNPLGGISTAIRTLRKFGHDSAARVDALDFIDRGVLALQEVTDATLQTHRTTDERRNLRERDLQDVGILAQADASRRDVTVRLDVRVPREVPVPASEIRQVLLNLMLNAIHASPGGGVVTLRARLEDATLRLDVEDSGRGLPPDLASGLMTGVPPAGEAGLGVAVIVRLVERLRGRVSVTARSQGGTHITLHVPTAAQAPVAEGTAGDVGLA